MIPNACPDIASLKDVFKKKKKKKKKKKMSKKKQNVICWTQIIYLLESCLLPAFLLFQDPGTI